MTRTTIKGIVAKVLAVGTLAAAFAIAAPVKAEAQQPVFATVEYPHYNYGRRDHFRYEQFRRHEEFRRREEFRRFERDRRFDRGYYR
jgi:hypothetical protein